MVHYKLIYFNGRGRAEGLRLLFAVAGVEYEDVRVQPDEWPALKPKTIFGKLPNIEIDGRTFCQANAIGRNLARKFNLAGKTELDQLRADMIIDCLDDILREYVAFFDEKDEARKEEMKKKYSEVELPAYYSNLEKILKSNKGGDGFFVGDDLTWPDLAFLSIVSWGKASGNESLLEKYPKLKALEKRVESVPRVAAWIAKRPVTAF